MYLPTIIESQRYRTTLRRTDSTAIVCRSPKTGVRCIVSLYDFDCHRNTNHACPSVFPGKNSIPTGCLYSYRVWLRVNGIDHRLFGEDDLWIGKDPDFASIGDASFARLKSVDTHKQLYHGFVGRALVTFIVRYVYISGYGEVLSSPGHGRWRSLSDGYYRYSLDYEANGVGGKLFDDYRIRLDGDPRTVTFLI